MRSFLSFFALVVIIVSVFAAERASTTATDVVLQTPGLVAFWDFKEEAGQPRVSAGTKEKHPLQEVGGPIARVAGGPFSGYSAELNGKQYFRIPYAETGDLNISGPEAQVSMFAVVRIVNLKLGESTIGRFGGLAVFNRALTDAEMRKLHEAANVVAGREPEL